MASNPYQPPDPDRPRYKFVPALPTWLGVACSAVLSLAFAYGFSATLAEQMRAGQAVATIDVLAQIARAANALILGCLAVSLMTGHRRLAFISSVVFLANTSVMIVALMVQR